MTEDMPMPGFGPGDLHPSTPYAFVRAALAKDSEAMTNLMASNDLRTLSLSLAALAVSLGERAHGSLDDLDVYLYKCQQASLQIEIDDAQTDGDK
ncbi:hypothetical protein [Streptomyces sp. NPDC093260]|uniref:hypothetical protein n=1 Tax=Streptomyces sp. NPDC093260 TaxID=3155073 RepID=UPI003447D975